MSILIKIIVSYCVLLLSFEIVKKLQLKKKYIITPSGRYCQKTVKYLYQVSLVSRYMFIIIYGLSSFNTLNILKVGNLKSLCFNIKSEYQHKSTSILADIGDITMSNLDFFSKLVLVPSVYRKTCYNNFLTSLTIEKFILIIVYLHGNNIIILALLPFLYSYRCFNIELL